MYKSQFISLDDKPGDTKCLLCDCIFVLPTNETEFLTHVFKEHRLVIADVWKIANLRRYDDQFLLPIIFLSFAVKYNNPDNFSYVHYWSIKFKETPLTTYCSTLIMHCTPDGQPSENEHYYLLSDCLSEDKTLRDEIHRAKLV